MKPAQNNDLLLVGKLGAAYGIKGWLHIHSFTDPIDNLFEYSPWFIKRNNAWVEIEFDDAKVHNQGTVAHIKGCDDRTSAQRLTGAEIAVPRDILPQSDNDAFYFKDLEGLTVITKQGVNLGNVDHLFETGANDVMVVKGDKRRLIPFLMQQTVLDVNLTSKQITVDWDPEF